MIIETFCDGKFWDNQTVYSKNPDFTLCFQHIILIWVPCMILWIISPIWIYMLIRQNKPKINRSWKIISKMVLTTCLILIEFFNVYKAFLDDKKIAFHYISPVVLIMTFILSMIITNYERCKGLTTSTLLFIFWLTLTLTSSLRLRSFTLNYFYESENRDIVAYSLYCVYFVILVFSTIISTFSLAKTTSEYKEDLKRLPISQESLLSKLWFSWLNNLIYTGYKRELVREDLWRVEEKESSLNNIKTFEKIWKKSADEYIKSTKKSNDKKQEKKNSRAKQIYKTKEEKVPLKSDQVETNEKNIEKPSILLALFKVFKGKLFATSLLKLVFDTTIFIGPIILDKLITFIKEKDQNVQVGFFLTLILFSSSLVQSVVIHQFIDRMVIIRTRVRTTIMNIVYKKVGEMTNLIGVNAQTVSDVVMGLNFIWSQPLQLSIAIYMLYQYLGVSALIGSASVVIFIPINILIVKRIKNLQKSKLDIQDSRIKMMSEIFAGIKVIKFYGWELSFQNIVQKIRNNELEIFKKMNLFGTASGTLMTSAPLIISIVSFASFILIDENNVLDANKAFVSLSLINIIRTPMAVIPHMISSMINANVSLKRIEDFLLKDEIDPKSISYENIPGLSIRVKNADFGFDKSNAYLKNLNLEVKKGELIAVVGEIGNGKSSLLSAILGEMYKLNNGILNLNGTSAYVSQQAWIQNATVRENILFGQEYNEKKYDEIIQAACLITDLNLMPSSDMTEIGEKGINLSGGQKQRISLARSLYSDSDMYFLDDPLSAVDSHVGKSLFDDVIGPSGLLKNKTRIFVTNSLSFLSQVDRVVMMENGKIVEIGSYEELLSNAKQFSKFIRHYLETKKVDDNKTIEENDKETTEKSKLTTKSVQLKSKLSNEKIIVKEKIETEKVKATVFKAYFKASGYKSSIFSIFLMGLTILVQISSNVWLSYWSDDMNKNNNNNTNNNNSTIINTEDETKYQKLSIFTSLSVLSLIIQTSAQLFFLIFILNGAKYLHNKMLQSILKSTMEFFESTPSGRIINRFSKDIDATEGSIPRCFEVLIKFIIQIVASVILISFSTPYFLLVFPPMMIFYFFIQRFFVASMRQLKRLESASKSPIFSHFSESLTGVSSIRAYKAQDRFNNEMQNRVDENLVYEFPYIYIDRWLSLRLDLIGNFICAAAALFAVIGRSTINPGVAALSITYALNVSGTLHALVRVSAEFESNITSIERIEEYCNTPHESEWVSSNTPKVNWPDNGKIVFDQYSVKYRKTLDNVLNKVDITINPGEKIGIVGRTGAGKSSLALALFRILEYSTGRILIDNVDIKYIGLHELRHKLTIIPQDPVLFSGSLRINLDPFTEYTDDRIWKALELAHLKKFIRTLDNGLEFECTEGGENLSVGQRQLICLARALLQKKKILLLDEATASVDHNTDELIQKTIRKEFADCTVLTVAHRLNTIMDSSRIMVLDKGSVAEFKNPDELIADNSSIFHSMAKDAGII